MNTIFIMRIIKALQVFLLTAGIIKTSSLNSNAILILHPLVSLKDGQIFLFSFPTKTETKSNPGRLQPE